MQFLPLRSFVPLFTKHKIILDILEILYQDKYAYNVFQSSEVQRIVWKALYIQSLTLYLFTDRGWGFHLTSKRCWI